MEAYSNGTARIRHRETGRIYEIDGLMLDWEIVDSDERQMGAEFHHEAVFEHPELGQIRAATCFDRMHPVLGFFGTFRTDFFDARIALVPDLRNRKPPAVPDRHDAEREA
jgi:hypothetical protein